MVWPGQLKDRSAIIGAEAPALCRAVEIPRSVENRDVRGQTSVTAARKGVNKSVRLGNGGARSVAHEEHDCDQHQRKTNEETGNRIRSFHLDSPGSGHGKPRDLSVAQVPSRGKGGWPHGDRKMRDETPPV